jgi:hypothetical protein
MPQMPIAIQVEDTAVEKTAYAKVFRQVVPFLMICYVVAYLDRINVGFAKLQMEVDLGFSETVYGLGAGMFFIGYFFFEVPSNMIMYRVGERLWIARIMITWGLLSALFVFVKTPFWFYTLRFLLGAAEAGFYPGVILYLTYWYPDHRRAAIVGQPFAGRLDSLLQLSLRTTLRLPSHSSPLRQVACSHAHLSSGHSRQPFCVAAELRRESRPSTLLEISPAL